MLMVSIHAAIIHGSLGMFLGPLYYMFQKWNLVRCLHWGFGKLWGWSWNMLSQPILILETSNWAHLKGLEKLFKRSTHLATLTCLQGPPGAPRHRAKKKFGSSVNLKQANQGFRLVPMMCLIVLTRKNYKNLTLNFASFSPWYARKSLDFQAKCQFIE